MKIMEWGVATAAKIAWLTAERYRYLVVSQERDRHFDRDHHRQVLRAVEESHFPLPSSEDFSTTNTESTAIAKTMAKAG